MDPVPLKEQISKLIQDIPVGLQWKMIITGIQGQVKEEDWIQTLHLYVNELDVKMAKPLLIALIESQPSTDHVFPLHIRMQLVPEIDLVLNLKGRKMLRSYEHARIPGIEQNLLSSKCGKSNFWIVKVES